MTEKQLKDQMNILYGQLLRTENKNDYKAAIAKAVQLGMKYQEEKIKEGIDIVFKELNK